MMTGEEKIQIEIEQTKGKVTQGWRGGHRAQRREGANWMWKPDTLYHTFTMLNSSTQTCGKKHPDPCRIGPKLIMAIKRPLSYSRSLPTRSSHPATTKTKAIPLLESFHSNAHIFKASHSVAHEQRTLSKGEELVRDSQKS